MAAGRLFGWLSAMHDDATGVGEGTAPWSVFEWSSSSDDTGLVDWAEAFRVGYLSASVDNTGPTPAFLWEQTSGGSASGSIDLIAGRMIRLVPPTFIGSPVTVSYLDAVPAGMWRSDQYGRPLDIDDLQA
jgi:hypothetical protein